MTDCCELRVVRSRKFRFNASRFTERQFYHDLSTAEVLPDLGAIITWTTTYAAAIDAGS